MYFQNIDFWRERAETLETANKILSVKLTKEERKRVKAEKERSAAARCIAEKCRFVESTERGDYCTTKDAPCDCCAGCWEVKEGQK